MNDLQRPLEKIANEVKGANASKHIGEVSKSVEKLGRHISDSAAMQSVDLLTESEVEELRKLVTLGAESNDYTSERLKDEAAQGMYMQLSDLGFIQCVFTFDGNVHYLGHTPKANWAIARHDKLAEIERMRKAEAERVRDEDRRHSRNNVIIGWFLGLATAALPYLAGLISSLPPLQSR